MSYWLHFLGRLLRNNSDDIASKERKGRDLNQLEMTKTPTPTEKSKKQRDTIKKTPPKTSITYDCKTT